MTPSKVSTPGERGRGIGWPALDELRRRTSSKWRAYPQDVLPMWIAEMDVDVAKPIAEAVERALRDGDTGYATGDAYQQALLDFSRERWGWQFDPAFATRVPDVMTGMADTLRVICDPGARMIINPPVYTPFFEVIERTSGELVEVPLTESGRLDLEALEAAFAAAGRGSAYLLCSPHNPTGTVHTAEELGRVAVLAGEHGVRVVADEIHAPLIHPGAEFIPYLSLDGTGDAIVVHSASKAWNLAGLKAGVAIGGAATAGEISRISRMTHSASHFGVISHTVALREGGPWLDALLPALDSNRALLAELLSEAVPAIAYAPPEATYLAWLDCRALDLGPDPARSFLDRGRVALNSGPTFGEAGAGFARMNFACSPETLAEGVRRIAAACA